MEPNGEKAATLSWLEIANNMCGVATLPQYPVI